MQRRQSIPQGAINSGRFEFVMATLASTVEGLLDPRDEFGVNLNCNSFPDLDDYQEAPGWAGE